MLAYLLRCRELWRIQIARRIWMLGGLLQPGMIAGVALFAWILGASGQARELFRILLEATHPNWLQIGTTLAAAFILSGLLFFTYRSFTSEVDFAPDAGIFTHCIAKGMPFLVAATPWLGALYALLGMRSELLAARSSIEALLVTASPEASTQAKLVFIHAERIMKNFDWALVIIIVTPIVTMALLGLSLRLNRHWPAFCDRTGLALHLAAGAILILFGVIATIGNFVYADVFTSLGALGVGAITTISFFALGLLFNRVSYLFGMRAWVAGVLLIAASYAILTWYRPAIATSPNLKAITAPPHPTAAASARAWIDGQPTEPGAMLVVSAQGGGMYAAVTSSLLLSRLRDKQPDFDRHLFAISAVSGGAVGSAFYTLLGKAGGCINQPGEHPPGSEPHIPSLVLRDYLAPMVGNLPADLLRKLRSLFAHSVDRSDALTQSLWTACPAMNQPYAAHWRPDRTGPALVLGTTWMANGHRVAFSPFSLKQAGDGTLWSFGDVYTNGIPTYRGEPFAPGLVDAVATSARFPGALPPLSLEYLGRRHNYGDGGYADASGATTAFELFEIIRSLAREKPQSIKPALLMITFAYDPVDPENDDGTIFTDTLAPLSALLGVRGNLADKAITRALNAKAATTTDILRITVSPDSYGIALGWALSQTSYEMISLLVGRPEWCPENATDEQRQNIIIQNSCTARDVLKLVRGGD